MRKRELSAQYPELARAIQEEARRGDGPPCPRCGTPMKPVERVGKRVRWRCPKCGEEVVT